jgi:hypothetical protein
MDLNSRTKGKMVNFRVSLSEYELYREACASNGLRNFSELARLAIRRFLDANECSAVTATKVHDLQNRIRALAAEIQQLARKIDRNPAAASSERSK